MFNPIIAVIVILAGSAAYVLVSNYSEGFAHDLDFRGYLGTIIVVVAGTANLVALNMVLIAAISLGISAIGVLTYGILTKKIGTKSKSNKPQLMIYSVLLIAISAAMILAEFYA